MLRLSDLSRVELTLYTAMILYISYDEAELIAKAYIDLSFTLVQLPEMPTIEIPHRAVFEMVTV